MLIIQQEPQSLILLNKVQISFIIVVNVPQTIVQEVRQVEQVAQPVLVSQVKRVDTGGMNTVNTQAVHN